MIWIIFSNPRQHQRQFDRWIIIKIRYFGYGFLVIRHIPSRREANACVKKRRIKYP